VTDTLTANLKVEPPGIDEMESGCSSEPYRGRVGTGYDIMRWGRIAGLALTIMASPATAVPDIWSIERRRRDVTTVVCTVQTAVGRHITRQEALSIARRVLVDAEEQRRIIAEFEAARGINWEVE